MDVNRAATTDGAAPVHAAARGGHAECLRQLIQAGADPNKRTKEGKSALDIIVEIAKKRGDEGTLRLVDQHAAANVPSLPAPKSSKCAACGVPGFPPAGAAAGASGSAPDEALASRRG